jgi:hypothetical protein
MPQDDLTEMFGEPISVYTDEQAVADGVLIHPYPQRWPWLLISLQVHAACDKKKHGRTYDQCAVPLLMDCIMAAQAAQKSKKKPPIVLEGTVAGTVWIMPNGMGGMTVLNPEER